MNLGQLEVFVAIVETGSLTEAAEVVGLTQSAVSYSLSKLEAELGVTLLERGRQGVTVTRVGDEVLPHARMILAQTEIIRQKTSRERGIAAGTVRFGCVPTIPARLLAGILRDFQHQYPDVDMMVFEGNSQELIAWLDEGIVDVATVLSPEQYPENVPFARSEIKALVAQSHPMAQAQTMPMSRFVDETLIGPKTEYATFRHLLHKHEMTMPRLRYEVSTLNTIVTMVRAGMGVSMMPEMLLDRDAADIVLLPFEPRLFMQVHLAVNHPSPVTKAFMTVAHRWAREHGFLPENI